MFLRLMKDFLIKKSVKKSLSDYKPADIGNKIQTIGLLIDETYFAKENELVSELVAGGVDRNAIEVLVYKDRIKKKETFENPFFSRADVSLKGDFRKQAVLDFIEKPFDMLISYYDIEKPILTLVTLQSKASFKVGFSTIDKRLNSFMITTIAEKHQEFVAELFKYLKILNKI
ncbi:hypothetical protein FLJC2902T_24280 [Flavobacterium limnosediminis JC2902]|uniref:Uncharacterized protein n=1 Tax=Flavobacterium limnosediminis JC2902 TaxID=1341181 RepID=V6SPV0_9FLAO|nr:hypothetical protein [Flavobacterium limnosediminis]ESU26460.1 hypothetical protein FLJC2902T_24280 [Flavobacterium limnosediminis JC2902]